MSRLTLVDVRGRSLVRLACPDGCAKGVPSAPGDIDLLFALGRECRSGPSDRASRIATWIDCISSVGSRELGADRSNGDPIKHTYPGSVVDSDLKSDREPDPDSNGNAHADGYAHAFGHTLNHADSINHPNPHNDTHANNYPHSHHGTASASNRLSPVRIGE